MVWIYGASGHGKVIMDILELNKVPLAGFIDDDESIKQFGGYEVKSQSNVNAGNSDVIIGVGNNATRKKIAESFPAHYFTAIHPSAVVSKLSTIAAGSAIMAQTVIQPGCAIGRHVIVNTSAAIDHDCQLGNYVHVSPGAVLCGNVTVGECTWIGAGSTVIQGVTIGKNVIVGAGSVIRKNVPDNVIIAGNPPKIIKNI